MSAAAGQLNSEFYNRSEVSAVRDEGAIFQDLLKLCTSPGYAHALAFLCYRDNIVRYSDQLTPESMENLFTAERLIRTETSTLIGLMVQGEIDWSLPVASTIQHYIDESEALLGELHEAMSAPALAELTEALEFGPKANPFEKGKNLREPIFYGGESAYFFQFRDFSVPKYRTDDAWLKLQRGFTIQEARDVIHAFVKMQNAKFAYCVDDLTQRSPEEWTFLHLFLFTVDELVEASGLERGLVERVVEAFLLSGRGRNEGFRAIDDFNAISATPIIAVGDGRLLLLDQYTLQQSLYESPFYWMGEDRAYRETALCNRGKFVESFAAERLELIFGSESVFRNVRIRAAKGRDAGEIDTLVLFADRALVVQAKSKRLTLEARKGNDNLIRDDFKKGVQDSYNQALSCAEAMGSKGRTLVGPDGAIITLPRQVKKIYILCLVADHYPALSFQSQQFLTYKANAVIQPPLILDVFTLDTMTEMLARPIFFLSYVDRRSEYRRKVHAGHELTILAYHLKRNLWFEKEYSLVTVEDGVTAELDVAMLARREGVEGARTPDGILTRLKGTRIGAIIEAIESRPDPGTINLGLTLLMLSENAVVSLSSEIDKMARRTAIDGQQHDLTVPMGESGEGLTVHCNTDPIALAGPRIKAHCLYRKYKERATRWYGICIGPDASLRFGINFEFAWQQDQRMEAELKSLPRTGLAVNMATPSGQRLKLGRNDRCPCQSGKKFKKCCLL